MCINWSFCIIDSLANTTSTDISSPRLEFIPVQCLLQSHKGSHVIWQNSSRTGDVAIPNVSNSLDSEDEEKQYEPVYAIQINKQSI